MKPLTGQQEKVLTFVHESSQANGFPPTLREIGQAVGLANVNAVRGHLMALEKKGYITKDPDKARSIRVVQAPSALSRFRRKLHEIAKTDKGVIHQMVYALAWMTTDRERVLTGNRKERTAEALQAECVEHGWTLLAANVQADHIRLVLQTWPDHSAALAVRRLKLACYAARQRKTLQVPYAGQWHKGYVATTNLEAFDGLVAQMLSEVEAKK